MTMMVSLLIVALMRTVPWKLTYNLATVEAVGRILHRLHFKKNARAMMNMKNGLRFCANHMGRRVGHLLVLGRVAKLK
jgi:hypothetical protein